MSFEKQDKTDNISPLFAIWTRLDTREWGNDQRQL